MAGRRNRLARSVRVASGLKETDRQVEANKTPPERAISSASHAPYGFQVQGTLKVDAAAMNVVSDHLVIDSPGKIKLDSHTGIWWLVKNTTLQGYIQADGTDNILLHNEVADGDIKFSGNDGGAGVTALTLDMSNEGAATFNAGVTITTTTGALLLPRLTTTQRNALTAANGMIIYNTTDSKFQGYAGGAWVNLH